jgi:hypothetical protein
VIGKDLNLDLKSLTVKNGINNINATDNFRAINYTLEANNQG